MIGKKIIQRFWVTDLLWSAPELIRENDTTGNKQGDVFSFAFVCAEIINMKPIWEQGEAKGNAEGGSA